MIERPTARDAMARLAAEVWRADHPEFWELFDAAWPTLERFAKYRLMTFGVPEEMLKDCVQDFFLKVYRHRATYRGDSERELWGWLAKACDNAGRDAISRELKRRKKIASSWMLYARHVETDKPSGDPSCAPGSAEALRAIRSCWRHLDDREQVVLAVRYFEPQLSQRGTAKALGYSPALICKIENRALVKLLKFLKQEGIDESPVEDTATA